MTEEEFRSAIQMVLMYSFEHLQKVKISLFSLMQEMEHEKTNISNEIRRSIYYLSISNGVKKKRIKYIDEVVIPRVNGQIESVVHDVFPEAKVTSLNRLIRFRREREQLLKVTNDHTLRVKQNAKLLIAAYEEIKVLEEKYQKVIESELVRNFLVRNGISIERIIEDEMFRLYQQFTQGG